LAGDEDEDYLIKGIKSGFHIIDSERDIPSVKVENHKSALQNKAAVTEIIMDEIDKERYIIVCDHQAACGCWKPNIISPLGLIPKSNGKYRLIHDCSLPHGKAVNDITLEMDKQSYESVDTAVDLMEVGCYMAKVDITAAYRAVAIHPSSYAAAGLCWKINGVDTVLIDKRLMFGARPSPNCFHRISQFIKRRMIHRGYDRIVAYQDDFLVIGSTIEQCQEAWETLMCLIRELGFNVNMDKVVAPTQVITFLGIELNSILMEISLPIDKLVKYRQYIRQFLGKTRASKRQLQSLAGKLNHAAKVVKGGRIFLRRILNSINKLRHGHHKCKVQGELKKDIEWWGAFIKDFNGVATCMDRNDCVTVVTDACLDAGGAFYNGDFYYVNWKVDYPALADLPINYKEAGMAALCIARWAHLWRNKMVYLYSDNMCTVSILNKCSCKDKNVMELLRTNFWLLASHNVVVKAMYLPGRLNHIADTVSRLHEGLGNLLQLESIINEWHLNHRYVDDAFKYVSLVNHMSIGALSELQDHEKWRIRRWPWMRSFSHL